MPIFEKTALYLLICFSMCITGNAQFLQNSGFETGSLSPWTAWNPAGTSTVVSGNAHNGIYAVQETGGETTIEQVVGGLQPNTTYTFEGWAQVASTGQSALMGVKNYGGSQVTVTVYTTTYTHYQVSFTTGATNTQATVFFYKPNNGTSYGDEFNLRANLVANPGFETGSLSPWTSWDPAGTSTVASGNAHSGTYAVEESGGTTSIEQVIAGLHPNTTYTLETWAEVGASGQSATLGAKNYGGLQVSVTDSTTGYANYQLSFTTGDTNTQATVFFYKPNTGTAHADDFDLYTLTPAITSAHTTYYIDNVNGDDGADGKSPATAWQSLARVNSTTFNAGDSLLFNSSGAWTGTLHPLGSGSPGNPIVIGSYGGTSTRPIINGNGALQVVYLSGQQYWEITGLELFNTANPGQKKRGIEVENKARNGNLTHIYIRNNYIHDILGDNTKDAGGSIGILVVARMGADSVVDWFDSVKIENNIVENINRVGISTAGEALCRGTGSTGCPAGTTAFRHTHVLIDNNYVANTTGDGIVPETADSALVEYNMVNCAGCDGVTNGGGMWPWMGNGDVFQFNEAYGNKTTSDGEGYDCDYGCDGTVFQYNYSHDNSGGFMLICTAYWGGNNNSVVRYNVSQNDHTHVFNLAGNIINSQVYNNTIYLPAGSGTVPINAGNWNGNPVSVFYSNNIFYLDSAGPWTNLNTIDTLVFNNSILYGKHTTGEPTGNNNLASDPKLANPGGGTSGSLLNGVLQFGNVDAYKLRTTSPALNAGILIAGNGGRDYWGNAVSPSAPPNIGAYNGSGVTTTAIAKPLTTATAAQLDQDSVTTHLAYPTPVHSGGRVTFLYNAPAAAAAARIDVYNVSGALVVSRELALMNGPNMLTIDLPNLSSGAYYAILSTAWARQRYSLMIMQ